MFVELSWFAISGRCEAAELVTCSGGSVLCNPTYLYASRRGSERCEEENNRYNRKHSDWNRISRGNEMNSNRHRCSIPFASPMLMFPLILTSAGHEPPAQTTTATSSLNSPDDTLHRPSYRRPLLEYTFIALMIWGAFVVRLWPLSKVHFWDEAVYLQNAEVICCGKANYSDLDSRPPLLSLMFAAIFLLWHHIYAADIATALLNALGPALLYVSGRTAVGRIPAAIASLLLAFSPFFVGVFPSGFPSDNTGNSLLSDSPALTIILLAFWLLVRALHRQSDLRFASVGFVFALAVLTRFASLSSIARFRFWFLPQLGGGGRRSLAPPDLLSGSCRTCAGRVCGTKAFSKPSAEAGSITKVPGNRPSSMPETLALFSVGSRS